ncbi:hypothetical protein VFPFJ_07681 [Purpureocillium lilacinum]|uniref:Uncharacterized protein n=1 Tax=Purpureocillium lilacinum TaxID=33203 RepID=A0A179GIN3_PURLI|nr:hypothetical protein VFPFJ_07681 [Purpureocillium lilacinum]OAQ77707.1 hypothetical protein VFPBJ_08179 [Purpureocillium lilacinum]OAQ85292.1 hypothetical protein VFPFJ_07681 [Purpureocillium lilacinum]
MHASEQAGNRANCQATGNPAVQTKQARRGRVAPCLGQKNKVCEARARELPKGGGRAERMDG